MRRAGLCYFFNLLYCKSIYRLALAQKKGGLSYSWLIMICLNSSMKFIKGISHRSLVDNHQISKLQLLICQIMIFDKFDNLFCQVWQLVNAMWSIHFCFSKNWILHFHGYGIVQDVPTYFATAISLPKNPQFWFLITRSNVTADPVSRCVIFPSKIAPYCTGGAD